MVGWRWRERRVTFAFEWESVVGSSMSSEMARKAKIRRADAALCSKVAAVAAVEVVVRFLMEAVVLLREMALR